MNKREIKVTDDKVKGFSRDITISEEDKDYFCTLFWDDNYGYDLEWHKEEPAFFTNWDEDKEGIDFELWLDNETSN